MKSTSKSKTVASFGVIGAVKNQTGTPDTKSKLQNFF